MKQILKPNVSLYLPLYETDGNSFMSRDAYGHLCTASGAFVTPQGRKFDGADDFISVPDSPALALNGDFSIECRVKYLTLPGTLDRTILARLSADCTLSNYEIYSGDFGSNVIGARWTVGVNNWKILNSLVAMTPDSFYSLVLVKKEDTMYFYVNGLITNSGACGGTVSAPAANLILGARRATSGFVNCVIGEVCIHRRALTPQEIHNNYAAANWRYR